jgi:hypothetical protein
LEFSYCRYFESRISVDKLNEIANGLLARTPEMAKEQKLVDIIAYEDVYHDAIRKALKVEKDEDYNKVSIFDYTKDDHHWHKYRFKKSNCRYLYREKFKVVKAMSTLGGFSVAQEEKQRCGCTCIDSPEEAHLHQI